MVFKGEASRKPQLTLPSRTLKDVFLNQVLVMKMVEEVKVRTDIMGRLAASKMARDMMHPSPERHCFFFLVV